MIDRTTILDLMRGILQRQGKPNDYGEDALLSDIGFRSLDFSELALRVETACGKPLSFGAAPLRAIRTVRDVVDFMERASGDQTDPPQSR
ncbi:MAG TPA: acyl carrier protein [Verrucomicrobiae bacterium]|nr:acyl carrier protein [Verrucomicrobiae bacterium]